MLSNDTKKIIDDARDTLVGQIPVPMMQCQQITLALVYKFMSDDDEQAIDMGGQPHYFIDDLDKYTWDKIASRRLDDTQRSELYREGLTALRNSQTMPTVFREIFKDAVVPYGDHRTLALFLDTMNRMEYDDSEKLGDAYEYLLKTAEAQADAGQFRTPRHIIDFIVNIVNPQKHEIIIDPACGTAGFLVSAYQHVKSQHELSGGETTLSTLDWTRLADNLKGYDISPEMTKLAMANMYLHTQNKNPNIDNYDTLTSTDHWNEYADVMLANPPFMTPKGGIKPHARFRVPAKRAEVLFVDYIATHLNEHGRAGIIVPEGIIFQSQNAYKQLRRLLLDESLVAVISLPGGVFNPYSGVKTSILILDKVLAPTTNHVGFFKVENDGYDLGAQRRPISQDDLPAVNDEINEYLRRLRAAESLKDFEPHTGLLVDRDRIADDGDYNFNGERYRENEARPTEWPMAELRNVAHIESGSRQKGGALSSGVPSIGGEQINNDGDLRLEKMKYISKEHFTQMKKGVLQKGDVLLVKDGATTGKTGYFEYEFQAAVNEHVFILRAKESTIPQYLYRMVRTNEFQQTLDPYIKGIIGGISLEVGSIKIPLPPLEVQRELVAEIEGYQRVIDGARTVVENWQPRIAVDPDWPVVRLPEICDINPETVTPAVAYPKSTIFYADISSVSNGDGRFIGYSEINSSEAPSRARRGISQGDILLSTVRPNLKAFTILDEVPERALASTGFAVLRARCGTADPGFILASLRSDDAVQQMVAMMGKGSYPSINQSDVASIQIPLPPLETQQAIVAELCEEQVAVDHAQRLAARMEQRIQNTIARVWED